MARNARRGQSSEVQDGDSLKENSAPPVTQMKQEKVKAAKVKSEVVKRSYTKHSRNEEDIHAGDEEYAQASQDGEERVFQRDANDEDDDDGEALSRSHKRARLSEEGDASEIKRENTRLKSRAVTLPRREDG
jgi:hypothetical protein